MVRKKKTKQNEDFSYGELFCLILKAGFFPFWGLFNDEKKENKTK